MTCSTILASLVPFPLCLDSLSFSVLVMQNYITYHITGKPVISARCRYIAGVYQVNTAESLWHASIYSRYDDAGAVPVMPF